MHDVTSRESEVDVGRPLVEVGRRCPPLSAYSRKPMRCRVMSLGIDVGLHEVTVFSTMYSKVLLRMFT